MSSKVARDRWRDSAASPPPALSIAKSHSSMCMDPKARRVDAILSRGVTVQNNTPQKCFNLAGNYRTNPRYHPQTILKNMRGATSLPSSPRGFSGVALFRSQSVPGLSIAPPVQRASSFDLARQQQPLRAASAPPTPAAPPMQEEEEPPAMCQRCIDKDATRLWPNCDSAWACVDCGVIDQISDMKGQKRAKNCEESKDPTTVNDGAPARSAQEAEYLSWSKGPESDEDKRRRQMAHVGGTRMSTQKLKQQHLIDGQNVIDAEARRNMEEMLREDGGPDQGRRKKIVRALEAVFDQLPGLNEDVGDYIRREAIRIYSNSMKHEAACGTGSMLALSQRTNVQIAYGVAEYVLETLADPSLAEGSAYATSLASITPEWSTKEVEAQLRVLNDVQVSKSNAALRMAVRSAVSIIAKWTPEQARSGAQRVSTPPPAVAAPAPPTRRPAALATSADSGNSIVALRERLVATAETTHAGEEVLNAALAQLHVPAAAAFLQEADHSCDVLAISLLAATALKLQQDDPTTNLRRCYLPNHNVSETTVQEFVDGLKGLIHVDDHEDIFK